MMNLISSRQKTSSCHFKDFARMKVRELGMDGAVQFFRHQKAYYNNTPKYENSYLYVRLAEMSIDYIVNDLGL